jgi:hypothetical protein
MTNTVLEQSPSGASPNEPAAPSIAKTPAKRPKNTDPRYLALRNFAISISIFNILGYTVLGFEQPWLWPLIAITTGYTTEITFEVISSWAQRRAPRFRGNGGRGLYEFLLPSHITALAVNMLLYANNQIMPVIFGVFVGVAGKHALQAPIGGRMRHFMNPSNFGITVSLVCFGSWISIAPPYEFTEKADTFFRVMIPIIIATAGTVINGVLTKRVGLIMGWMGGFFIQALVRHAIWHVALFSAFGPMTGVAFVLFTNYMITDPGTTPSKFRNQFMFGGSVAFVYAVLMEFNVVYTLFFATTVVCASRGIGWWAAALYQRRKASRTPMAALPDNSAGAEAVAA